MALTLKVLSTVPERSEDKELTKTTLKQRKHTLLILPKPCFGDTLKKGVLKGFGSLKI